MPGVIAIIHQNHLLGLHRLGIDAYGPLEIGAHLLGDLAERHVDEDGLSEAGEQIIARCVRVFDPCLTCATH